MKHLIAALVAALGLSAAACSDPQAPAAPTLAPATINETFGGTLTVQSRNAHTFNVNAVGPVKVTLTSVVPGAVLGIGVGILSSGACNTSRSTNVVPGATVQLDGVATVPGQFCVGVFDIGNLVEPVDYTLRVTHS